MSELLLASAKPSENMIYLARREIRQLGDSVHCTVTPAPRKHVQPERQKVGAETGGFALLFQLLWWRLHPCCCALARFLGKVTKKISLVMVYSALFRNVL
jgi:hypothetical protein